MKITFRGSKTIEFGRKLGSKDKKKRKVIDNGPSAEGQLPLTPEGQQRTGYKYYRKRRALAFLGIPATIGGLYGAAGGAGVSTILSRGKTPTKKAMLAGALLGSGITTGSALLEHATNKYSPFYQKKLFNKKKK